MVQYDARVIQEFADRLYRAARGLMFVYAMGGALAGGTGGALLGALLMSRRALAEVGLETEPGLLGGCAGLVVGLLLGAELGREKSFTLRLRAQDALCQVKIQEGIDWLVRNATRVPPTS